MRANRSTNHTPSAAHVATHVRTQSIEVLSPGIYSMAAERYHAAAGASKSMLDVLAEKTPAHLQAYLDGEAREETEAMRFGTILHRALLEPDTYQGSFYTKPEKLSFATNAGKAWKEVHCDKPILSEGSAKQIEQMVSAVHTHPFAKRLLAGAQPEQSLFVEDTHGTLRKSRLDALTKGNVIPDMNTKGEILRPLGCSGREPAQSASASRRGTDAS